MAIWAPNQHITVKVLGLIWRGDELLAFEVTDSSETVRGVRPLGGTVQFGQSLEETMHREFREELGCAVTIDGQWHGIENIFSHEGRVGHQYMFVADVSLIGTNYYSQDRIEFYEDDGSACSAGWYSPTSLPDGVELFPTALLPLITSGAVNRKGRCLI